MSNNRTRTSHDDERRDRDSAGDKLVAAVTTTCHVIAVACRFARRHPLLAWVNPAIGVVAWIGGLAGLGGVVGLVAVGLAGWWGTDPEAFDRQVTNRVRTGWRWEWRYYRCWSKAMALCALARVYKGKEVTPKLTRVECSWATDVLHITEPPGQEPVDWEIKASEVAESFGALSGRVRRVKPGKIRLELVVRRLDDVVEPLPITPAERLDLNAVPVGRLGDGSTFTLGIKEVNTKFSGRAGAGKTEGAGLSVIRGVAAAIGTGEVVVWAADPKGGTGLAHGPLGANGEPTCPLFCRVAWSEEAIARMMFDALDLMYAREVDLRHEGLRKYEPSAECPTVIVWIDELLSITRLAEDTQLGVEVTAVITKLLSRARAVGIILLGAEQDPREKAQPFADGFQVKVCMGVARAALVDVVLGQGAWAAGAHAERIPIGEAGAGQCYVRSDDDGDGGVPVWGRFSRVDRACVDEMGELYPTPWAWHESRGLYRPADDPAAALAVMERLASALHIPVGKRARGRVVDITDRLGRQGAAGDLDRRPATAPASRVAGTY